MDLPPAVASGSRRRYVRQLLEYLSQDFGWKAMDGQERVFRAAARNVECCELFRGHSAHALKERQLSV